MVLTNGNRQREFDRQVANLLFTSSKLLVLFLFVERHAHPLTIDRYSGMNYRYQTEMH